MVAGSPRARERRFDDSIAPSLDPRRDRRALRNPRPRSARYSLASCGGAARLSSEADIDAKNKSDSTPLHFAPFSDFATGARVSLESGTPLQTAAFNHSVAVARVLIEGGAELEARENPGQISLHLAAFFDRSGIVHMLIDARADVDADARADVDVDADVDAMGANGGTPLQASAFNDSVTVARMLIEGGAELEARENPGQISLHLAAFFDHSGIVHMLIDAGADVDAMGANGGTPLQASAFNDSAAAALLPIEAGTDRRARTDEGFAPARVAKESGAYRVIQALKDAESF